MAATPSCFYGSIHWAAPFAFHKVYDGKVPHYEVGC
jgi:hypothetical protein